VHEELLSTRCEGGRLKNRSCCSHPAQRTDQKSCSQNNGAVYEILTVICAVQTEGSYMALCIAQDAKAPLEVKLFENMIKNPTSTANEHKF
jgi:hypothetical protein